MSRVRLPPEMMDHVIDFLHDDLEALEQCALVSKSWVPRSRKLLFTTVEFHSPAEIEGWKWTFPNPSNSPAGHTLNLTIYCPGYVEMDDAAEGGWISSFSHVIRLNLDNYGVDDGPVTPLGPFYTFVSTLKSLTISSLILSCSQTFDFIRSLPHLEDLSLVSDTVLEDDGSDGPWATAPFSTPPPLTGTLELALSHGMAGVTRRLLDPPNNLRFRKLVLTLCEKGPRSIPELVEVCSPTLEYLDIKYELEDGSKNGTFPINLAKATKLKGLVFRCESSGCGWMSEALWSMHKFEGFAPQDFQHLSIHIPSKLGTVSLQERLVIESQMEQVQEQWSDLNCCLIYLNSSKFIRTKVVYPRFRTAEGGRFVDYWIKYMFGYSMGYVDIDKESDEAW